MIRIRYYVICTAVQLHYYCLSCLVYVYACMLQDVIAYRIIEKSPDTDLFYLHPVTGVLTLKTVWPQGDKDSYNVSRYVYLIDGDSSSGIYDQGLPQRIVHILRLNTSSCLDPTSRMSSFTTSSLVFHIFFLLGTASPAPF